SLVLGQKLGSAYFLIPALEGCASLCALEQCFAQAAGLMGTIAAARDTSHMPHWRGYADQCERHHRLVEHELGSLRYDELWTAGRALALDAAAAAALGHAEAAHGRPGEELAEQTAAPALLHQIPLPQRLTVREVEVLRLIAAGQSTREIAAALSIAEGTVERHVTHLYGKIGVRNRAEATSYAHEHALLALRHTGLDDLSEREIEVLRLIAVGQRNSEIATRLVMSENTVFQHVRSILNKTGCANCTEAAAYALRNGLVE
ncbi:MAG TPA: LuxR C-terminal-related transcriptional regulator, partial [Dehalococcoidia bacterium]|nr:LuxR C-terminal-related transcriptional regulator [Dehalococcoidia bacterium]